MDVDSFEFDKNQRDAVDKTEQVGTAFMEFARDPKLGGEEIIIFLGMIPIDDPKRLDIFIAAFIWQVDFYPVFEQIIDFAVRLHCADQRAVTR